MAKTDSVTARDPILSLFQSAAAAVSRALHGPAGASDQATLATAAAQIVSAETANPVHLPPSSVFQPALTCAQHGLALLQALAARDTDQTQVLLDRLRFSECDPLWVETLLRFARLYLPGGTLPCRIAATRRCPISS